jgi:Icc protein|tara:strand:+ start:1891 stop:2742 length:852 start_codon:yes stop_codon:yes gene_type:complete
MIETGKKIRSSASMSLAELAGTDYVCIVQLTDSHLFAADSDDLLGLDTLDSLNSVVDLVLSEIARMDLVLATGDIAQDASELAYRRFIEASLQLPAPCHWIPGNHDDAAMMQRLGAASGMSQDWVDIGSWRIVLLDSSVSGSVAGYLADSQLQRFDDALATAGDRHLLVCLHHHPVDIGCSWMQPIGLRNADTFFARLAGQSAVKAVLWGHVHQAFDGERSGVRLMATPSTCVQFATDSEDFATDTLAPGYRWLRLYDDGRIETEVSRLPPGSYLPDPGATGY